MALKFDPSPYLQAFQFGQSRDDQYKQQLAQALQAIPQGINQFAQIPEQQKQDRMNQVLLWQKLKDSNFDPTPIVNYVDTGKFPTQSPVKSLNSSSMPNQMSQPPTTGPMFADAGVSDVPQAYPKTFSDTSIIDAHNKHLQSQGLPGVPKPSQGQGRGFDSLFYRTPIDYAKINSDLEKGDPTSFFQLPQNQRGEVEKVREFNLRQQELNNKKTETPDYDPQDFIDAQNSDFESIAKRHGGKIPHGMGSLIETASSKSDAAYEKKRNDAQTALTNVRGDQSIARTEAQRDAAALAYNTIERIKKENRLPTQLEYYDILGQMWKARTGASPTDQALQDLDQKTFQGNLGKAYTFFSGKTAGATTKDVLRNLQDFIAESGVEAEKQHEGYMAPRRTKILNGLEPEDQERLNNMTRGLSFQDQTGYRPKVRVSNGRETLEIDQADEAAAAADGYRRI